ncbi:MAG: hypothetical protein CME07_05760 [Gemmatimonadetes bacterium]|nr:hypothetical protein [Gemmatimonadota bacterium]
MQRFFCRGAGGSVRIAFACVSIAVLSHTPASAASPGDTGLAFLKIGVGARAAGMGEAYVAVAQDATSQHWNPAGIATARGLEVHASHNEWISDVRYEWLAAVKGLRGHAVGVHMALLSMGELEGRDANGDFTENFRAWDMLLGLTYGRRISESLEIGLTGKLLHERIQGFGASGVSMDFGARYRTPVRGLVLAATATNIGTPMKFEHDEFVLPAGMRAGLAYRTRRILEGLILAADAVMPNDADLRGHLGMELRVHEMVALRGGVKLNHDEEMGTAGLGVHYGPYRFDYAYTPFTESSSLGDVHRVSMTWNR